MLGSIQRVVLQTEFILHFLRVRRFPDVVIVISLEGEFVDLMGEVVLATVVSEVGNKFIVVPGAGLERATWGKVDVSDNLVDAYTTSNVAAFVGLFPELIGPSLVLALE